MSHPLIEDDDERKAIARRGHNVPLRLRAMRTRCEHELRQYEYSPSFAGATAAAASAIGSRRRRLRREAYTSASERAEGRKKTSGL
uniref:Uncharacterized protein n=1 Tax=Oryza meridionalis TaxID=40149 RepID=A0A0E0CM48_9ORYZ